LKVEGSGKGKGRADGRETGRKPWDPPVRMGIGRRGFGMGMRVGMGSEGFDVPSTPPKKTGREMEAKGVAIRLFPPDGEGGYMYDQAPNNEIPGPNRETTPRPTHTSTRSPQDVTYDTPSDHPPQHRKSKRKPSAMSALWTCIAILAFLLFILLFAILIAHCLAWFLVYKTEARLGEARRGIMQGGEMRLCLCAA